jgi:hypothetical protein
MGEEIIILSIRPCRTSRVLLHAVKYDVGPSRFTFHPRGRCAADFYSKDILVGQIHGHVSPSFSCFTTMCLLVTARELWWVNQE